MSLKDIASKILAVTHGRTTAFFIAFFVAGHGMAVLGKLNSDYVLFMGTLGGLVLGHSIQENKFAAMRGSPPPPGADPGKDV